VGRHEVELCRMVIRTHEEVRLVFVCGGVSRRRLRRRREALEVEFVRVPLPVDFRHDILVVVIPATQFLFSLSSWKKICKMSV